ncbi:hypothetical protein HZP94_12595 [Elizabethkingia anophelis]|nr:hypothetical protein [Elizabethkingia anophelis]MCT4063415.1 hypothetical protein [Elizabethkingia anophelis]MCT4109707.1 hypothetical protein [Elizabethkingia anophelis]
MKNKIQIISMLFFSIIFYAQEIKPVQNPPVNVEAMFATNGMVLQTMINKKFQSMPRIGFFSVTSLISDWNENKLTDFMNQSALTFEIVKGFNVTAGYHYTEHTGFRGTTGILYTFNKRDLTLVIYPRIDLSKNSHFEGFVMAEYKPKINETISFYSRIQGLYAIRFNDDTHQRSYIMARAGISYKEFTFGIGLNVDYFGPIKQNINNLGIFAAANVF